MKSAAKALTVILFAAFLIAPRAEAVLPPEDHEQFVNSFLSEVDVRAYIVFESWESPKWQLGEKLVCRAFYNVAHVLERPEILNLEAGDRIALAYPCESSGQWSWLGSNLPWTATQPDGRIEMRLIARYLMPDGPNRWQIANDPSVFVPFGAGE